MLSVPRYVVWSSFYETLQFSKIFAVLLITPLDELLKFYNFYTEMSQNLRKIYFSNFHLNINLIKFWICVGIMNSFEASNVLLLVLLSQSFASIFCHPMGNHSDQVG